MCVLFCAKIQRFILLRVTNMMSHQIEDNDRKANKDKKKEQTEIRFILFCFSHNSNVMYENDDGKRIPRIF